ncbi:unnamed protein product [Urochloa humidicola]
MAAVDVVRYAHHAALRRVMDALPRERRCRGDSGGGRLRRRGGSRRGRLSGRRPLQRAWPGDAAPPRRAAATCSRAGGRQRRRRRSGPAAVGG